MIKTKKVKKVITVIEDIICNKCGASLKAGENFNGLDGFVYSEYGSKYLEDGTEYKFNLCEKCLKNLFKTFKIKVEEKHD